MILGLVAGIVLFDSGPGVEPLVVAAAVAGTVAAAVAEVRTRRRRDTS